MPSQFASRSEPDGSNDCFTSRAEDHGGPTAAPLPAGTKMLTRDDARALLSAHAALLAPLRLEILGDAEEVGVVMREGQVVSVQPTLDAAEQWAEHRFPGRDFTLHRLLRNPPYVPRASGRA